MSQADEYREVRSAVDSLKPMSFRRLEDVRRLAVHFKEILSDERTQSCPKMYKYLASLDERNKQAFLRRPETDVVEYIYASETKNNQQRQRFNSLSVVEVSELLKMEFANAEKSIKVHICTECNVEIETNDEEPLQESLQKHFSLEVHQPKKALDSSEVSEPIVLPNLSRRKSAMVERGEAIAPVTIEHLEKIMKDNLEFKPEKPDRLFSAKLETFLVRNLPDNSEAGLNAAVKFHQSTYEKLCQDVANVDFSPLTSTVAPIIMSIKDNVTHHFASEKPAEEDDDKGPKTPKKLRYYGQIESSICKLLSNHKLLTLVDDRTCKPAFFCVACEYYTLRFCYDSVLNHVFSDTHVHNLAAIFEADPHIPFCLKDKSFKSVSDLNCAFLVEHGISETNQGYECGICMTHLESREQVIVHSLDDNHLGRLSDSLYRKAKSTNPDAPIPEDWGQKAVDWSKHLAASGRVSMVRDTVVLENFIKASGKGANHCPSCEMTLKGPRQVLFNHVRQKKHVRNVAPLKLQYLYKNHCRPVEYYASFGSFYTCAICPNMPVLPSFSAMVGHIESDEHMHRLSLLIKMAVTEKSDAILNDCAIDGLKCRVCDADFATVKQVVEHVLSDVNHTSALVEMKADRYKGDIISAYMKGKYVLFNQKCVFYCVVCNGQFASVRSLLMHLVYAEHFDKKPSSEDVFRFYLELKHNIGLLARNKYSYDEFGSLYCNACDTLLSGTNAKRHVMSASHRERVATGAEEQA